MCRSCDRQDGDVISTQCSGGNNIWAAWFVLFNPRLNLSEVSRRRVFGEIFTHISEISTKAIQNCIKTCRSLPCLSLPVRGKGRVGDGEGERETNNTNL